MLDALPSTGRAAQSNSTVYTTLEGKENTIRLLKATKNLLSRTTVWTLVDYQLDGDSARRHYTALSYCWGSDELAKSITLDGVEFYILESVHAIIQAIESDMDFSSGSESWWWIDSVCINQSDLQERASQVKLMGRIYREADRTLGWLGKGSNYPEKESEDFTARGELAIQSLLLLRTRRREFVDESREPTRAQAAASLESQISWSAIQELFKRPWWTRVWTLQEFLIPERFELWCGNSRISRGCLCKVIYIIWHIRRIPGYKKVIEERDWLPVWNRRRVFMWQGILGDTLPLVALVAYGSDCQATDPKDRIYSVLDLAKGRHDNGLVQPCYEEGYLVSDAYTDFAKAFIERHASLDIICFADIFHDRETDDPKLPGLPTWVPHWATKVESFVIPVLASQTSNPQIGNLRKMDDVDADRTAIPYNASKGRKAKFEFLDGNRTLKCRGIFIDTIGDAGSNATGIKLEKRKLLSEGEASALLDDIARTLVVNRNDRCLSKEYTAGQFYHDLRALCLAASERLNSKSSSSSSSSKNNDKSNPADTREISSIFLAWFESIQNNLIRGHTLPEISSLSQENPVFAAEYARRGTINLSSKNKFVSRFDDTVRAMGKKFIVSSEMGRLGMAGGRCKSGDRVCVLVGCSVPVLLRRTGRGKGDESSDSGSLDGGGTKKDDAEKQLAVTEKEGVYYEFVGECYLEGFMDGEAIDMAERLGGFEYEDVLIV